MSQDQIEKILEKLESLKDSLVEEIQGIQLNCTTHTFKTETMWEEHKKKNTTISENKEPNREAFYWKVICGLLTVLTGLIQVIK